MNKLLSFAILVALVGCQSSKTIITSNASLNSNEACKYLERDLTTSWKNRKYWCVPDGYQEHQNITQSTNEGITLFSGKDKTSPKQKQTKRPKDWWIEKK